jgi:hypothetical protein
MTTPPAMSTDELQQSLAGAFPSAVVPYLVEGITGTGIRLRLPVGEADGRPGGTVSGPSLMALVDVVAKAQVTYSIPPR